MTDLNFKLHPKQMQVFNSPARFKVGAAGRRGGKSYLSAVELLIEGLKTKNKYGMDITNKEVWYIAPTFQQAKDIMWLLLKTLGKDVIKSTLENTATIRLINGRTIQLKGSDRPDTLRGVGISFVVLDEYAYMKPSVWDLIIRPTLADVKGSALFIGTPEGKNHFYDLWTWANSPESGEEWEAFQFNSTDNPTLDPKEIEMARLTMSSAAFRQEFEASFEAAGGGSFKEEWLQIVDSNPNPAGNKFMAVDLAGFSREQGMVKSDLKRLDEHALTVVDVSPSGWFIEDIWHGRWDVRETSLKIIRMAQKYQPSVVGIEKGALKNAVTPYLEDQMARLGVWPHIVPVTHGGVKKIERINWALQGRFEHGRIWLKRGNWNKAFINQYNDFPNPLAHDDLLDSLAYIDQVSQTVYSDFSGLPEWEPLDVHTGI